MRRGFKFDFWNGCLSGLGVAAGLALLWFAFHFDSLRAMFNEFGGEISPLTSLVTSPLYLRIVPLVVFGAVVLSNFWIQQPRRLFVVLACVLALAAAAVVFGYRGAMSPITALSNPISGD